MEGESVTDYVTRLRKKVALCKFSEYNEEAAIIDQFIEHCLSNSLRIKLLATKDLSLEILLSLAESRELAMTHAEDIVKNVKSDTSLTGSRNQLEIKDDSEAAWATYTSKPKYCYGCGRNNHVHKSQNCPAKDIICFKCGHKGHFQSVCLSKGKTRNNSSVNQIKSIHNDITSSHIVTHISL